MAVPCRRCRGEDGAFLILWALLLVALLTMVAIVIDMGALRADRRTDRAAADAAAIAGALELRNGWPQACQAAWEYAVTNLRASPTGSPCPAPGTVTCTTGTSATTVKGTASGYTIALTYPVPDGHPLIQGSDAVGGDIPQAPTSAADGLASGCQRVGVEISYTRATTFGKVIGMNNNTTTSHSVALEVSGITGTPANLVILDPTRCPAMSSGGTGGIEVTGTSPTLHGAVVVVSDGTGPGCSSNYVLDVGTGNTGSHITVTDPGDIYLPALTGGACAAPACDPGQLNATTGYFPAPKKPLTVPDRSLVDYKYNCRSNYDSAGTAPNYRRVFKRGTSGTVLAACTGANVTSPESDYVNRVFRAIAAGSLEPLAPTVYPGPGICPLPAPVPPNPSTVNGNVRFDCTMPNNVDLIVNGDAWFNDTAILTPKSLVVNGNAVFSGGVGLGTNNALTVNGNAEFRGGSVSVSGSGASGGRLTISGVGGGCTSAALVSSANSCVKLSSPQSALVFLGAGVTALSQNGGNVALDHTVVFMAGGTTAAPLAGPIFTLAGSSNITWTAPTAGPFADLLGWSDKVSNYTSVATASATSHSLAGGGSVSILGVFFSPTAQVQFTGSATITPQRAQFWANTLVQNGGGRFTMTPDGSFIPVPIAEGSRLIR